MLKYLALGLAAIVAILIGVVALQPSAFSIERSATIAAPPGVIYPHINDLRAMSEWSPYMKLDPEMKVTWDGPDSGVGATQAWEGEKAGKGVMTITSVKPNEQVDMELRFLAPMQATNRAVFTLTPAGDATRVSWRMEGANGFMGKAFSLLVDMDELVGNDFDKGLADLKRVAEAEAGTTPPVGSAP